MNYLYKYILVGSLMLSGYLPVFSQQYSWVDRTEDLEISKRNVTLLTTENKNGSRSRDNQESLVKEYINQSDTIRLLAPEGTPQTQQTVDLGFNKMKEKDIVAATSTVNVLDYITYNDIQDVSGFVDGFLTGTMGINNIRGQGNVLYVIDGIPGRDISAVNTDEIEQITVLKDVNALALFGSQGKNGAIVITTRRGKIGKNRIEANASYGVKVPIMYPDYVGSAEYMQLYNEARANDGLTSLYDEETIQHTQDRLNPYKYPDVDFYSDDFVKSFTTQTNVTTNFIGGNDRIRYFVNLNYKHDGTLEELNPDANRGKNRYKVRGNLDFKINDWINSTVDVMTMLTNNRIAHSSVLSAGATFRPNLYAPLLPVSMVDTTINEQLSSIKTYDGYILGGSNSYTGITPIANIYAQGYVKNIDHITQVSNTLDFNLDRFTEGLSAKTFVSLDYYDSYRLSVNNSFNFYEPTWRNDTIVGLQALGEADRKDQTENISTTSSSLRYGFYGQLNYVKQINEDHYMDAMFMGYSNSLIVDGTTQIDKQSHLSLSVNYNYKHKLYADFSSAYSNSMKLAEGNRGGFSPTLGLAYVLSEEDFLKDSKVLDYFKVRASGGILKTDIGIDEYFLYKEVFDISDAGVYTWADGARSTNRTVLLNGRNPDLTFANRTELNLGFEASMFKSIWLEMNYFNITMGDQITQQSNSLYPSFYTAFTPYSNYNEDQYHGFEIGVRYSKTMGDFYTSIGANVLYVKSEVKKFDELVEYDYLSRIGQSTNAIRGMVDDGFYQYSDFTENGELISSLPVPQFGEVRPGDIKYVDQNNDGLIDASDNKFIGNSLFPYTFGLNMLFKYKSLSLFVRGKGQSGADAMLNGDYYWVDGDDKYSTFVRNRWTDGTANTATYPRLTSKSNNNNFRNSTFWLYNKSYFDIDKVQLTYELNKETCHKIGFENLSINISGANLVKFAPNKDYLELNVGSNPQFRYFTIGLRTSL